MPVSRPDFLHRIFAQLDMMPCNVNETNLLVYVDGDLDLFNTARNFVIQSKFKERLCVYRRKGLPSVNHIRSRRQRIAEIHTEIQAIIGTCDYIFLLEDDTLFPLNTLERLLKAYGMSPHAGLITGVQVGRHGMFVPGIWKVDNPYNIQRIQSQMPITTTNPVMKDWEVFQEIDAAGLYCCITKAEHYKKAKFEPFDAILGPDVSFGLALRREGYKNYVDWSLNTDHLTKTGEITIKNVTLQQITFTKLEPNRWEQQLV